MNLSVPATLRALAKAASVVTLLIGLTALVGWLLDLPFLKSILPNAVTMKVNTALGFVLLGTALFLKLTPQAEGDKRMRILAQGSALLAAAIGAITLTEYLFGWTPGIDQLLVEEPPGAVWTYALGRMAPNTALNFVLLGVAILLLDSKTDRGIGTAQCFTLAAATIGFLGLLGYAYGVSSLYGFLNYTRMAIHTSFCFLIVSVGTFFASPLSGPMAVVAGPGVGGVLARRLMPAAIVIPFVLGLLARMGEQMELYDNAFGHSLVVMGNVVVFCILIVITSRVLERVDAARAESFNLLRKAGEELENRVRERTAELTNAVTHQKSLENQLRQAQKMEAVGQLAGGVAHDFNNILTAIIGYGNLLTMKMSEGDKLKVYVEQILKSAERAADVTHNLLAFSRKQVIHSLPVDVNDIIRRVEKLLDRIIGEDIELRTILSDTNPTIMADAGLIEQVLMNLVTNARDSMPHGGCLIISTERVELDDTFLQAHGYGKAGVYALVSVSDTGAGMDKETMRKIFEPFFTTKEVGKGTGLGLAMVYGIVKQHDGYINVYSEPGKGTTFRIYLPKIESKKEALAMPAPVVPLKGGSETVLMAEDDEKLRALSEIILKEYGYRVIMAEDGEDVVARFKEHKDEVQLVILDMVMPKKGGKEAYEQIRLIRPDIKVLFSSGYTAEKIDKDGIMGEGLDFIAKPASPQVFLRKVREVLDKR